LHLSFFAFFSHHFFMQKLLRTFLLAAAVSTTLGTTSCGSKNDDPQAQTQTAVLSGQVTPAASVTTVTATDASGKTYTATITSTTGAYAFAAMPVGDYTLTFTPATGYVAPASVAAKLAGGGTTAPAITVALAAASASYVVDGTAMTATYVFSQGMGTTGRMLTFTANPGAAPPTVTIFLDTFLPTVGSRSLTANGSGNNGRYMGLDYLLYMSDYGSSVGLPVSGTFTISSVSTSPRVFSGTFSFLGTASNPPATSPVTRNITSGVFTNLPY
jgi:hypothetical protein